MSSTARSVREVRNLNGIRTNIFFVQLITVETFLFVVHNYGLENEAMRLSGTADDRHREEWLRRGLVKAQEYKPRVTVSLSDAIECQTSWGFLAVEFSDRPFN